jgi:hypothetical protein
MPIPIWVPGQILTSSDVDTWFVPKVIIKPSQTSRASTTSMTNDPDLVLALASSASYTINGVIFYDGATASSSDIKWTFTVPSGSNGQYFVPHQNLSGSFTGAFQSNWTDTLTANTNGVGSVMCLDFAGIIQTGGSTGNLQFQWAQNSSNATNTHVNAQSYLVATRIG